MKVEPAIPTKVLVVNDEIAKEWIDNQYIRNEASVGPALVSWWEVKIFEMK